MKDFLDQALTIANDIRRYDRQLMILKVLINLIECYYYFYENRAFLLIFNNPNTAILMTTCVLHSVFYIKVILIVRLLSFY